MNVNPFSYLIEKLKSKVSKSGDTMTGNLIIQENAERYVECANTDKSTAVFLQSANDGSHGIFSNGYYDGSFHSEDKWLLVRAGNNKVYVNGTEIPYGSTLALKSDITWNYLGIINGSLPLPSSFNELFIRCDFEKAGIYSVISIPKVALVASERTYGSGNYALSNVNYGFEVYVSTTSIRTNWIFKNNGDIKSTSEIAVYYR